MSGSRPKDSFLLGKDALKNVRLGISVSESSDLRRLGLREAHFLLAIGELARCVLVSGGHLNYGGHLEPKGYTTFIIHELQRFSRRDRPFHSVLAWNVHRSMSVEDIRRQQRALGLYGDITGLDEQGHEIDLYANRPAGPAPVQDPAVVRKSLTSMRRYLTEKSQGRIFLGGKRAGFQGDLPGLLEEALLAIEADQPVYLAGGFGGITADIARIVGVGKSLQMPDTINELDPRAKVGLERLESLWQGTGKSYPDNGLSEAQNTVLAASHRPSEIAALVSLGLGRMFANQ